MTTNDVAAYLSNVLYSDFAKGDSFGDAGRFVVKDVIDDPASGYYGAVIHDTYTGDGILVNRGTEIDPIDTNDFLNANASIAFGGLGGQQYTSAQQFLSNYLNDPNQNVAVTATTGHSLGGYLAQVVGMTRGLDVIAIASPGANNALNDLANTSYASQVAAYDKSRITVINDPRDSVGQHNEQIAEINYQTVDLNDLVLQSDKGNIYSFIANQTEYDVDFFDALVVFGPVTAISSFAVESWAGLAYHNRDFYQQVITQNYNEVNNSPALISIATVENGDTISFYETITKIDSSTGSDITFLEYSDGNIYGLRNNPDGSKAFFYKDQQGNTISRNFESFDNLEGLDGNEKRLVEEIRVRELLEEKAAALEQIQSNPDIVNDPSFNDLPLGVQEKILELLETGELALEETAPKTEIITVSETISSDLLVSAYLEGDGLGSGADILSVSSLVHAIQNGPKSAQIDASLELYKRVVNEGSYNGDLGFYELDGAILQAVPNAYGGFAEKITYNGQDQVYFTRYGEGSFQQRVVETVGEDGRTNTAQITLIDGLVNQLYHGEPIQISYPENFDYGATTGIIADVIGQQLENGELAHDIISGAIIRTLGTNAGEVLDFLAAGNTLAESVFDPIFGVDGSNPNMPRADIIDDLLVNLQSSVVSVISSKLVEELGDVIGIDGVGGEVFDVAAGTITTGVVNETFGLLFNGLDTGVYTGILSGGLNFSDSLPDGITVPEGVETVGDYVQYQVVNALAAYAGNSLAGEVVEPESEIAAIFGSAGSAIGTAIATGSLWASSGIATAFANLGWAGGPLGVAIGAFIGNVAGTFLGNVFGGEDEPWAGARGGYDSDTQLYKIGSWGTDDGGDASIARSMLQQVINGVNSVLEITQGKIRSGAKAPGIEIGYDGDEYFVAIEGQYKVFSTAVDAIYHASYKLMSEFDLVGGHAVIMRAWHNTDADNLFELKEDLEVAEAFQNYLANPTAILALMMNEPESELAQSWAAILQRAAELELHLPHDKDLDGGWSEILLAQGADPSLIPDIQGDNIVLTDPVTGEETVVHHVIGPGYEIVRIEGTDGNDIIEVIVDGPSISYVNAGAGDDVIEGSEQDDILVGGAGDDTINGNGGNDWLHGGTGDDNLDGGAGEDLIVGGMQNDYLIGGDDNDHIYGNHGDDILMGMAGQDFLYGGQGNDVL
ncbi:MAG: hypothetical protein HRT94_07635, partial [Alphaproteobacteria bacterium]|nr:hypothetical protein [Alphaproteobacteria bacterium]